MIAETYNQLVDVNTSQKLFANSRHQTVVIGLSDDDLLRLSGYIKIAEHVIKKVKEIYPNVKEMSIWK